MAGVAGGNLLVLRVSGWTGSNNEPTVKKLRIFTQLSGQCWAWLRAITPHYRHRCARDAPHMEDHDCKITACGEPALQPHYLLL